ncbi:cellulase family glycosylhydrolase [candidate division KSB1 bacterium]|nr:cellulase family glycosylhydrolase [candidate division KSB1 bacterium]
MNKLLVLFTILFVTTILPLEIFAQEAEQPSYHAWWRDGFGRWPRRNPKARSLPLIQVKGNSFVNTNGDTILFRGLAISDPDKIANQGHWDQKHFEKVKEMGATLVRIPVHPVAWRERTPQKYLELLDQAVEWCTDLKMYIIIDWHSIGNLNMELFQNPMYDTTKKETYEFWQTIARHFRGHNTVAFYEIFNEPTIYRGQLGSMTWPEWKKINEDIIRLIRAWDTEPIPLVAGFDWAYDLTPLRIDPINAEGIGYVSHPYAHKRNQPWEPKWEEAFGFAADNYPVMATELGFGMRSSDKIDKDHYGPRIINYLESRRMSWVCWVFDPEWGPNMMKSWETYELTPSGEFFKKAMHGQVREKDKK